MTDLRTEKQETAGPARSWDLVARQDAPLAILVPRNVMLLVAAGLAVAALVTLPSAERTTSRS